MKTRLIALAAAGFIAAAVSAPAVAQSGCVKEVFHKYCLGGSVQPLLNRHTPLRTTTSRDGVATVYVFADGQEQTTVSVVNGRIETVTRHQHPGVQSTFDRLEGELRSLYGEPRRASSAKGDVTSIWDRGQWRVTLRHVVGRGEVNLSYRHEALQAARKASAGTQSSGYNPKGY